MSEDKRQKKQGYLQQLFDDAGIDTTDKLEKPKPTTRADSEVDPALKKAVSDQFEKALADAAAKPTKTGDTERTEQSTDKVGEADVDDLPGEVAPRPDAPADDEGDNSSTSSEETIIMAGDAITAEEMAKLLSDDRKKGSRVEPEKFSGLTKENATSWMRKYKQFASTTNMTEDEKITNFSMLMRGMADIWYGSYLDQMNDAWDAKKKAGTLKDNEKWEDISKAFLENFTKSKHCNLHKLYNIKLSDFKDSEAYTNYIQQIGSTLNLEGNALIPYVMKGLPDELYARVASHQPRTLADHISRIALEDTLMKVNRPKPEVKAVETQGDRKIAALAEAILQMNDKLTELATATTRTQERPNNGGYSGGYQKDNRRRDDRGRRDPPRCYNCDRVGHFSRDCRAKRQNNSNGNGNGRSNGNYNGNRDGGSGRRNNGPRGPRFDNQDNQNGNANHQGQNGDGQNAPKN